MSAGAMLAPAPLLEVRHLGKRFTLPRSSMFGAAGSLQALSDVSFTLEAGQSLGIVGESGSGKSTLAKLVMALDKPSEGQVLLAGVDVHQLGPADLRRLRPRFQMVFQDPYSSLDPRQKVRQIVTEPLEVLSPGSAAEMHERAAQALSEVGLRTSDLDKYPHEFSGGQRQRIAMARALITRPSLIVADEPVSALDVSVQAQVLNLMMDLQDRYGLSYLFVSHDLAVVKLMCDDVLVLQSGCVVEQGTAQQVFNQAQHPYTQALMAAVPGQN
ncbi:ATP-binding cassette domain-containing protein [Limnohabitans sp. DM1]|uniref:ATP-binding cassette domain-containing protein n=1 Tax=Limnohabitans sp. DM1 TaxID=1597955 RepID=UPI000AF7E263|nr:ATP-binding cassette domain-containing protein [Limnohabitans sp. DM1]